MRKEELRAQQLINDFPVETLPARSRELWKKLKREDNLTLTLVMTGLALSGIPIVVVVILVWPQIDYSPLSGLILLGVGCGALLFKRGLKGQVLRVWRYLKK